VRLTNDHLTYWRQRKSNPRWASNIPRKSGTSERRVSIDTVVNQHAGPVDLQKDHFEAGNAVSLLKLARKNGDLLECMARCAWGPHRHQHLKRAAYCSRWLKKLGYERIKETA
jgi:hypothetical protein